MSGSALAPVIAGMAVGVALVILFASSFQMYMFVPDRAVNQNVREKLPDDFGVIYSTDTVVSIAPVLDTANDLFVKDMVCDPDIQIKLVLSDKELERIWQSVADNDFFNIAADLTDRCGKSNFSNSICVGIEPSFASTLTVTANGQTHSVKYSNAIRPINDRHIDNYQNIIDQMWSVLNDREELNELPEPRCGYL